MADYNTNLKAWGSSGQEFPDNYSYLENEAPVDAWDNFVTSNIIGDIKDHLIPLTNSRIESDYGTSQPGSPEDGHLFYDTDDGERRLFRFRADTSSWEDLAMGKDLRNHENRSDNPHSVSLEQARAQANGLSGDVDFGANLVKNVSAITGGHTVDLADAESWGVTSSATSSDLFTVTEDGSVSVDNGDLTVAGRLVVQSNIDLSTNNAVGIGLLQFGDADSDGDQWTVTEDSTSGNLQARHAGAAVLDVGDSDVNVTGATLSEQGNRVATRTWVDNNADVPNADYADSAGDADTVDGNHASAFANSGHTHALGDLSNVTASGEGAGNGFNADQVDGWDKADIQSWVNNNSDVPNADTLDGEHASAFADSGHTHDNKYILESGDTMSGVLTLSDGSQAASQSWVNNNTSSYTDSEAVSAVNAETSLSVDISGDADTLDGEHASSFADSGHTHSQLHDKYTDNEARWAVQAGDLSRIQFANSEHTDLSQLGLGWDNSEGGGGVDGGLIVKDNSGNNAWVTHSSHGAYDIQKNGSDTNGVINFKT